MRNFLKKNAVSLLLGLALVGVLVWVLTSGPRATEEVGHYPPVEVEGGAGAAMTPGAPAQMQGGAEATPAEGITFCLKLNGQKNMHMPDLMGSGGEAVYRNNDGGSNWSILPGTSVQGGAVGVLDDGRVYVKASFLKDWGMKTGVEIISAKTGWTPDAMQEATVAGEPAYIY